MPKRKAKSLDQQPLNFDFEIPTAMLASLAEKLTLRFTEQNEIPARYRRGGSAGRVVKNSALQQQFDRRVAEWEKALRVMISHLGEETAWRLASLNPVVASSESRLTANADFVTFIEYMVQRRDVDQCSDDELGCLASLSVGIQREIENRLAG